MNTDKYISAICGIFFSIFTLSSHAVVIDLKTVPLTIGTNSVSFDSNGIAATVSGYHVEYDSSDSSTTIYGPFSTTDSGLSAGWDAPYFGRSLNKVTNVQFGLGLIESEDLGQTDTALTQGFDNTSNNTVLPGFEFALFSFSAPVTVSEVIVDDVSNFDRDIWVAGGDIAPDLSKDFLTAISGYTVINSSDDSTDGTFIHSFTPLVGISYLLIGTPPNEDIGNLGPVNSTNKSVKLYIDALNVSQVPVPPAVWLFGSGLIGLIGVARRKTI